MEFDGTEYNREHFTGQAIGGSMDILNFTKEDTDTEGIAWVASAINKIKSDLFVHTRMEITDAAEGSYVVATSGSVMFMYETREQIDSGYYEILKASKTEVVLHRDCEINYDGQEFPSWEDNFKLLRTSDSSCPALGFDRISISKSYSDVVRELPKDCSVVFELFTLALAGPGIRMSHVLSPDDDNSKTTVQLEGGRCRAVVLVAWDSEETAGEK